MRIKIENIPLLKTNWLIISKNLYTHNTTWFNTNICSYDDKMKRSPNQIFCQEWRVLLFRPTQHNLTRVLLAYIFNIHHRVMLIGGYGRKLSVPRLLMHAGNQPWNQHRSSQTWKCTKGGINRPKVGKEKENYIQHLQEIINNIYMEKICLNEPTWTPTHTPFHLLP